MTSGGTSVTLCRASEFADGGCLLAQVALIGKNYDLINEILVAADEERERRQATRRPVAEG